MKRMLFVSWGAYLGGVESSTYTRIKALQKLGVESDKVFYSNGVGLDTYFDVPTHVIKKTDAFAALVKKGKFDVVSLINFTHFLEGLRKINFSGKTIIEIRGNLGDGLKNFSKLSTSEVEAIIVPSTYVAKLVDPYIKNIPIKIVPDPIDCQIFKPMTISNYGFLSDIKLPTKPSVLWVGRLDRNKNWPEMLSIAYSLIKSGYNTDFIVVGDITLSSDLNNFKAHVRKLNLQSKVHLIPNVPYKNMPLIYNNVAQFGGCILSTSKSEGFQNSLLEAMACGCPVVSSKVGGNIDFIEHGVSGMLYPLGKTKIAAKYLTNLLENSKHRQYIVANALNRVRENYDAPIHANQFLQVINSISR